MRISDWSSDVCSSDLRRNAGEQYGDARQRHREQGDAEMKARQQPLQRGVADGSIGHDAPPSSRPICSTRGSTRSGPRPMASRLAEKPSPAGFRTRQNMAHKRKAGTSSVIVRTERGAEESQKEHR